MPILAYWLNSAIIGCMNTLIGVGEGVPLPLGLTSDSSVGDLKKALHSALLSGVDGQRKEVKSGLRLDVTMTDPELNAQQSC